MRVTPTPRPLQLGIDLSLCARPGAQTLHVPVLLRERQIAPCPVMLGDRQVGEVWSTWGSPTLGTLRLTYPGILQA